MQSDDTMSRLITETIKHDIGDGVFGVSVTKDYDHRDEPMLRIVVAVKPDQWPEPRKAQQLSLRLRAMVWDSGDKATYPYVRYVSQRDAIERGLELA